MPNSLRKSEGALIETTKVKKGVNGEKDQTKTEKKPAKIKKEPKKPDVFKAGKWNPDTKLVEIEQEKAGEGLQNYTCCTRCNARALFRAVNTGDEKLLKKLVHDQKNIHSLSVTWSVDSPHLLLDTITQTQNTKFFKPLYMIDSPGYKSRRTGGVNALNSFYGDDRVKPRKYLLNYVDSGNVAATSYGQAIRRVEMTRGSRQGNNAF